MLVPSIYSAHTHASPPITLSCCSALPEYSEKPRFNDCKIASSDWSKQSLRNDFILQGPVYLLYYHSNLNKEIKILITAIEEKS